MYGGLLGRRLRSIWRAWDARGAEGRTLRSKILSDDGFSPGQLVVISNGGKKGTVPHNHNARGPLHNS